MVTIGSKSLLCICFPLAGLLTACGSDSAGDTLEHYRSTEYGLSFTYDGSLYLHEAPFGDGDTPLLSLALVPDEPTNRAFLAGELLEPMEGPPMITVEVYDNPSALSPEDWVTEHTNWILRDKRPELTEIGNRRYLMYYWDGLYAGQSAITSHKRFMIVLSVQWITEQDALLTHFSNLLQSVELT